MRQAALVGLLQLRVLQELLLQVVGNMSLREAMLEPVELPLLVKMGLVRLQRQQRAAVRVLMFPMCPDRIFPLCLRLLQR